MIMSAQEEEQSSNPPPPSVCKRRSEARQDDVALERAVSKLDGSSILVIV
jgi:hypothetical protein